MNLGLEYLDRIVKNSCNLRLYPSVYVVDCFSSQIPVARPISVDKTELIIY